MLTATLRAVAGSFAVRPRRSRRWVPLAAVAGAFLTSCAGSGSTYLTNRTTGTFLKVPDSWAVFTKDQVLAQKSDYLVADKADRFLVAFDADPKPSLDHSMITGKHPFGQVRVRQLSPQERDRYSFVSLRNEIVPVDGFLEKDGQSVELLSPPELISRGALRGSRLDYAVRLAEGSFHVSQIGFVDSSTRNVWFLAVGCSEACYQRNEAAIRRVIDSWTVRPDD